MRIIHVLAILFFASTCRAETLSQLITDARVLASDASSSSRQRFSDAQVTEFLNQGQRIAIAQTLCLGQSLQFNLSVGVTYYTLPAQFLTVERVTRNLYGALTEISPKALDARSRGWEQQSGTPVYYFVNFSSRGVIGFAPFPQASTDTDTVKVEMDVYANDLVNGTDVPYNGVGELTQFHHSLAFYAASVMQTINGLSTSAQSYFNIFTSDVKKMGDNCGSRPNYSPSAVASP